MKMTYYSLKNFGAVAGAVVAIWGAIALARPLLESDPAPLAGKSRVELLAQSFETLQRNNSNIEKHLERSDQTLDLTQLDLFNQLLETAREDARHNPNSRAARQDVCDLVDRINRIRARQKMPTLAPCSP